MKKVIAIIPDRGRSNGLLGKNIILLGGGAIEKIQQGFKPDQQKIINFLAALDKVCIKGHDHHRLNVLTPIPEEVTIKNIADEYYRRINLSN